MTAKERDELIRTLFEGDQAVSQAKGHDYSGDEDCLRNLTRHGLKGIVVRLGDKYERLNNLVWNEITPAVLEEKIEELFRDMANYCYLGRVILAEKNRNPRSPIEEYVIQYHRSSDGTSLSMIIVASNAQNAIQQFPYKEGDWVIDEVYPKAERFNAYENEEKEEA